MKSLKSGADTARGCVKKHPPRFTVRDVAQLVIQGRWTIPKIIKAKQALGKSAYQSADVLSAAISCVLETHENYTMGKEDFKSEVATSSSEPRRKINN